MSQLKNPPQLVATTALPNPSDPIQYDFFAGFLSYLLPGVGQISQGRTAKGLLFFFSLHVFFFYGMALGHWKNVWIPKKAAHGRFWISRVASDLYDRQQFLGQFFIGMGAWPAIYQYATYDPTTNEGPKWGSFQRAPSVEEINQLQRDNNKTWDLGWVYTVIAGVLNLLVIYDAIAGPAFREVPGSNKKNDPKAAEEPVKV